VAICGKYCVASGIRAETDIAGEGFSYLTSGLLSLTGAGATYLPQLAGWFLRLTDEKRDSIAASPAGAVKARLIPLVK
jgi:hypothetical protein